MTVLGMTFALLLSGCPGGADLEDPAKYGLSGGMPATGTGGTTSTGGTAGSGTAGSGTASGGAAGALTVDCGSTTYAAALTNNCTSAGCHRAGIAPPAGLVLTPDSGLVARLKDVPATHEDVTCSGANDTSCPCSDYICTTPPATCPTGALLVNSATPSASWILAKIDTVPMCGSQMPGVAFQGPDDKTCIENMVNVIAALPK
jgi:hypothetical protein